jgi:hypothetical protein
MCSDEEWETIANVVQFLKNFKTATEELSSIKYPTFSLVLLFISEMVATSNLHALPTDSAVVILMKQRMRQALYHRLPVTELNLFAALLDPSQCNLTVVQDFLIVQETTAVHLLSQVMDKYVGGLKASVYNNEE